MPAAPINVLEFDRLIDGAISQALGTASQAAQVEAARITEVEARHQWAGSFVQVSGDSRWAAAFACKGEVPWTRPEPLGQGILSLLIPPVLDYMKPSDEDPMQLLDWVVKGGKTIMQHRQLDTLARSLDGAMALKEIIEHVAERRNKHINKKVNDALDAPLEEVQRYGKPVWSHAEATLREINLDEIRYGGLFGRIWRDSLADYVREPHAERRAEGPPLAAVGQFTFGRRLEITRACLLRAAIAAYTARAWALWLKYRGRAPGDNDALGWPKYEGKVDLMARQRFFTSYSLRLESLAGQLGGLIADLGRLFDQAANWQNWYDGI
jgi:hypothetical protein